MVTALEQPFMYEFCTIQALYNNNNNNNNNNNITL